MDRSGTTLRGRGRGRAVDVDDGDIEAVDRTVRVNDCDIIVSLGADRRRAAVRVVIARAPPGSPNNSMRNSDLIFYGF